MEIMREQPAAANPGDQMMETPQAEPFEICIRVMGDGTFEVGVDKPDAPGDTETPGMESQEDAGYRPARDVKEALTIALQLIKQGGKPAAADFQAGYNETPER